MIKPLSVGAVILLAACSPEDDNHRPAYGKKGGYPVNCRAYVQVVIDDYRNKKYGADEAFNGLERNCGMNGYIWKENRKD